MNLRTRLKLLMLKFKLEAEVTDALYTAIENCTAERFKIDNFEFITASRKDVSYEIRAVIKEEGAGRGIACTVDGYKMVNSPVAKEIIKFIVEFNKTQREQNASRYEKARRNGGPRLGGRSDKSDDSSN